jgi:hypothetical protein
MDGTGLFTCMICIWLMMNLIWTVLYFWHMISYACQEDKLWVPEKESTKDIIWPNIWINTTYTHM